MGTATLMEVDVVRTHVETGITDNALQRVLDASEQDIDQRHGALASQVDDLIGGLKSVWTTRPNGSIDTVVETIGTTDTALSSNDYVQRHDTQLDRLNTGDNGRQRWGDRVKITYTPTDDVDRRRDVLVRLIKLSLEYTGHDSAKDGDFTSKPLSYSTEREKILSALESKGFFV